MSYLGPTETVLRVDPSTGSDRDGLAGPAGGRLATRTGSTLRHLLVDPHGNLTAAEGTGATTIVEAIRTDAWGVELDTYPTTPSGLADVGYGGRFDLAPSGADPLYDFGARDYVPGLGAFASLDTYQGSITEPRSLHRFAYAWGNPATLIDPTGHASWQPGQICPWGPDDCAETDWSPEDYDLPAGPAPGTDEPETGTEDPKAPTGTGPSGDSVNPWALDADPTWNSILAELGNACRWSRDEAACTQLQALEAFEKSNYDVYCEVHAQECRDIEDAQRQEALLTIALGIEALALGITILSPLPGDEAIVAGGAAGTAAARASISGRLQGMLERAITWAGQNGLFSRAATRSPGVTVLGHTPDYINLARQLGARYYDPPDILSRILSREYRWRLNEGFLRATVANGDVVRLSGPVQRPGAFQREINFLLNAGYSWDPNISLQLLPPR